MDLDALQRRWIARFIAPNGMNGMNGRAALLFSERHSILPPSHTALTRFGI